MLSTVVLTDLNQIEFENDNDKEIWEDISKENQLSKLLESSLKEALYIGDGAFKITYDSKISNYPIIEFYPGDQVEYNTVRGRIQEVIFKTVYEHKGQSYVLYETYGYGYIKNRLTEEGKEILETAVSLWQQAQQEFERQMGKERAQLLLQLLEEIISL